AGASAWSLIVSATAGGATGTSTGVMTYASWLEAYNQPATLPDDGDFDHDGISNLMEYALGLQLNARDHSGLPTLGVATIGDEQYLTLTFSRRIDATDAVCHVEVTDQPNGAWVSLDPLNPQNQLDALADVPEIGWQTLVIKDSV